ncbi:hypothetical protein B0H12DRAFT_1326356 [Mycena haematopus]|nr:hypothetical protein B0H12DRAFT_1326356 [Mycena haematopus]
MTATVPLSAIATCLEDLDAPLTTKFLFSKDKAHLHRDMEYLWGLEMHDGSDSRTRKSMGPSPSGGSRWTLVPTEETLIAMRALQTHNFTVPVSERKSFLTVSHISLIDPLTRRLTMPQEFSAPEYQYIFVPLHTDIDFFILQPGEAPRRFSAPYADFPLVSSSANPFFVTFDSRPKIRRSHVSGSETWHDVYGDLTMHWYNGVIPEDFLLSCYPETLITESDDESNPDALLVGLESRSGSDETVVPTPMSEEGPSPVPHKEAFVYDWVQRHAIPSNRPPPTPRGDQTRDLGPSQSCPGCSSVADRVEAGKGPYCPFINTTFASDVLWRPEVNHLYQFIKLYRFTLFF